MCRALIPAGTLMERVRMGRTAERESLSMTIDVKSKIPVTQ